MRRKAVSGFLIIAALALLAAQMPCHAASPAGVKAEEFILDNGLKVILLENHKAPVVTFQVWHRVGSRNETWRKTGLSHLLEHMMFKGTPAVSGRDFSRIVQENGGNYNAFTSTDYTAYFETMSADRIGVAITLEADRMRNLVLREEDFHTERMVVMEERRQRTDDSPKAYMVEQLHAAAFVEQPYHWPIIGWMDDIKRLKLEDLRAYYERYYSPANSFVVVVGDFKKEEMLAKIKQAFGPFPAGAGVPRTQFVDPPQAGERRIFVKKEARLPAVVHAYKVPNIRDPDSFVLEVIEGVLSNGKSSRLYRKLVREEKIALAVDAGNPLLSVDPDLFMVSAECLPGRTTDEAEKAIDAEIARLKSEPLGERELAKAKNQIEAGFVFSQDSLFSQAMLLARYETALDWRLLDKYIPGIRKVTAGDIMRVAKKYFTPENRTTAVLVPLPIPESRASSMIDEPMTKGPVR
jgi:zinc protease